MTARLAAILRWARSRDVDRKALHAREFASFATLDRYTTLAGLILWAGTTWNASDRHQGASELPSPRSRAPLRSSRKCGRCLTPSCRSSRDTAPHVWQISLNRQALPALEKSVPAVKGDAARTLFKMTAVRSPGGRGLGHRRWTPGLQGHRQGTADSSAASISATSDGS